MRLPLLLAGVLTMLVVTGPPSVAATSPLQAAIAAASREFGVPAPLLLAVSYAETRWVDHGAAPSFLLGYGPMHLQDSPENDGLRAAAALVGQPPDALKANLAQNVRGAAALLREGYVAAYPSDRGMALAHELGRWYLPVASYLRSDQPVAIRNYTDAVFARLERGAVERRGGQVITLQPSAGLRPDRGAYETVPNDWMKQLRGTAASLGGKLVAPARSYAQAGADEWRATGNYTPGRTDTLREIVIHVCGGGFEGCVSWLQNPNSYVSAHYVVSGGGYRVQLVHDQDTAWHAQSHNPYSVGIEHAGWYTDGWFPDSMYRNSAWIPAWRCYLFNFGACDRWTILGHSELGQGKPDPGPAWDWARYITCVQERWNYIRYQQQPLYCP